MGDRNPNVEQTPAESPLIDLYKSASSGQSGRYGLPPSSRNELAHNGSTTAFHSQLEHFSQQQQQPHQHAHQYGQQHFDMAALAGALPPSNQQSMNVPAHFGPADASGISSTASTYHMQHAGQPPTGGARAQQQYLGPQYASMPQQSPMMPRQPVPIQMQGQYAQFDPFAYGINPVQPQYDPRLIPQGPFGMAPNMPRDMGQFTRRASEPAPVPSFPRGPPRKPKQSGHALWVGNLPPQATVMDLKDHFSRDATKDIESLFLISKSNCAFVNYRSEAACIAAMTRFHDSRFHGVRLVCRLRRGSVASTTPEAAPMVDGVEPESSTDSLTDATTPAIAEEPTSPTIVGSNSSSTASTKPAPSPGEPPTKVPEKFFIVKSLTVQDLEASVRNGIWATQSHNEGSLNEAYGQADNVYLIFSANKSGEYFGYARMASTITGEPVNLSSSSHQSDAHSPGAPQSIPTAATTTAPRGRIIDDSARGTIFWEAELSDNGDDESPEKETGESSSGQNWGRQFAIEWMSTSKLPFYRTRGLRNPWNANREVKIARDGTELEPSVGRRLVQMFHRPSPGQ
ncbi:hypothetical protein LTR37_018479 [Vermiconidia calcicola]|uniref:Uncharacterized protein n=1 Tax=Vermiconidia calcicola TaxID=1690605 RepID=A0ACC3MI99_9PEZI|nr:hypothetical protein LTR37_018479 [Vermiconidia calcicola]